MKDSQRLEEVMPPCGVRFLGHLVLPSDLVPYSSCSTCLSLDRNRSIDLSLFSYGIQLWKRTTAIARRTAQNQGRSFHEASRRTPRPEAGTATRPSLALPGRRLGLLPLSCPHHDSTQLPCSHFQVDQLIQRR